MENNEGNQWVELLEGLQRPETQADPRNEKVFRSTELFLEAGARLAAMDLTVDTAHEGPPFGWSRLTRDRVVKEARRLKMECRDGDLRDVATGEGAFRDRWRREQDYLGDLTVYVLYSSRWRDILESARGKLAIGTEEVRAGRQRFSDLISRVAVRNIGMRIRFAKYFIFQLTLMMDSRYMPFASKANAKVDERHSDFWITAYREVLQKLNLKLRPDVDLERVGIMLSRLAEGFTLHAAVTDDTSDNQQEKLLFAQAVLLMIGGAIDPGDHRRIVDFIDQLPSADH